MAGNATVSLYDGGSITSYDIWMQSLNTASQTEFQMQQVRNGISWIPIRCAEMFLTFSVLWPVAISHNKKQPLDAGYSGIDPTDGFAKMMKFQNAIRKHQLAIANGVTDVAMVLNYKNNSDPATYNKLISTKPLNPLVYEGWIQTADMEYARFKNVYVRNYTMNILTKNTANPSLGYKQSATNVSTNITYAPTAADLEAYGSAWVNTQQLISNSYAQIKGLP